MVYGIVGYIFEELTEIPWKYTDCIMHHAMAKTVENNITTR